MKKVSFAGISIALLIGLFYTFVFCMVGDVEETVNTYTDYLPVGETEYLGTVNETANAENSAENEQTTPEVFEKFIETSWWKANLEAYTSTDVSTETTAAETTPITTTTVQTTVTTTPATTTSIVTTTPATTTPETTKVTTASLAATTPTPILPSTDETVSYVVNGSKFRANAYDAVCQIVSAEMSSDFNVEAIKAQAVATYTFLKYNNAKGISPSVSIKTAVPSKIAEAVRSVYGLTVYYGGAIAQTVYCSSSGGYTAAARNVWGSDVGCLQSVIGDFDSFDRYYGVTKTFSEADVRSIIESTTGLSLSNDPANWFTILSAEQGGVLDGGYNGNMLIDGNSYYNKNGNKVQITGRVIRENIFAFRLNSAKFTVDYQNGNFTFTTYGYGHGVGMSQLGANLYASKGGYSYLDILQHYYTGITVS